MKTVVIIGAGPAGLSAAHRLLSKSGDYRIVVLEKETAIGGLSKTIDFDGKRVDLGGHRLFTQSKSVSNWWNSIRVNQTIISQDCPAEMPLKKRKSSILFRGMRFAYPLQFRLDEMKKLGFTTIIKIGFSFLFSNHGWRKETYNSLEDLYRRRFGKYLYSLFFKGYTQKVWGRHPSGISADWGEQRVQTLDIKSIVAENLCIGKGKGRDKMRTLAGEFRYPIMGIGELWENVRLEVEQMGGQVVTGANVNALVTSEGKIRSVKYSFRGHCEEITADYVISSMPLRELCYDIDIAPMDIRKLATQLPYRDMVIIGMSFRIEDRGRILCTNNHALSDDMWLYIQDAAVKLGRLQIVNNWSEAMCHGELVLAMEYFCQENDEFWSSTDQILADCCISELKHLQVISRDATSTGFKVSRVQKAYPAYWDGYYHLDKVRDWLDTISNLFCVGRNGQHRYNNMDHSVLTGFVSADMIINSSASSDRTALWNINGHQDYLEESTVI